MYKKVSTDLNFVDREKQTEKFWEDNDIFRKSMENRRWHSIMYIRSAEEVLSEHL